MTMQEILAARRASALLARATFAWKPERTQKGTIKAVWDGEGGLQRDTLYGAQARRALQSQFGVSDRQTGDRNVTVERLDPETGKVKKEKQTQVSAQAARDLVWEHIQKMAAGDPTVARTIKVTKHRMRTAQKEIEAAAKEMAAGGGQEKVAAAQEQMAAAVSAVSAELAAKGPPPPEVKQAVGSAAGFAVAGLTPEEKATLGRLLIGLLGDGASPQAAQQAAQQLNQHVDGLPPEEKARAAGAVAKFAGALGGIGSGIAGAVLGVGRGVAGAAAGAVAGQDFTVDPRTGQKLPPGVVWDPLHGRPVAKKGVVKVVRERTLGVAGEALNSMLRVPQGSTHGSILGAAGHAIKDALLAPYRLLRFFVGGKGVLATALGAAAGFGLAGPAGAAVGAGAGAGLAALGRTGAALRSAWNSPYDPTRRREIGGLSGMIGKAVAWGVRQATAAANSFVGRNVLPFIMPAVWLATAVAPPIAAAALLPGTWAAVGGAVGVMWTAYQLSTVGRRWWVGKAGQFEANRLARDDGNPEQQLAREVLEGRGVQVDPPPAMPPEAAPGLALPGGRDAPHPDDDLPVAAEQSWTTDPREAVPGWDGRRYDNLPRPDVRAMRDRIVAAVRPMPNGRYYTQDAEKVRKEVETALFNYLRDNRHDAVAFAKEVTGEDVAGDFSAVQALKEWVNAPFDVLKGRANRFDSRKSFADTLARTGDLFHAFAWVKGPRSRYWLPAGKPDRAAFRLYGKKAEEAARVAGKRDEEDAAARARLDEKWEIPEELRYKGPPTDEELDALLGPKDPPEPPKAKRGRPVGSKNKPKPPPKKRKTYTPSPGTSPGEFRREGDVYAVTRRSRTEVGGAPVTAVTDVRADASLKALQARAAALAARPAPPPGPDGKPDFKALKKHVDDGVVTGRALQWGYDMKAAGAALDAAAAQIDGYAQKSPRQAALTARELTGIEPRDADHAAKLLKAWVGETADLLSGKKSPLDAGGVKVAKLSERAVRVARFAECRRRLAGVRTLCERLLAA